MKTENWKCICFKEAENKKLSLALKAMLPYIENENLADRFGLNPCKEEELIRCQDLWFLNPNEDFEKDLESEGLKLSRCYPKDTLGNSVLNP